MNDLLKFAIEGHGGLENWNKFNKVSAHINVEGMTWERKQQPGILKDINVNVDIQQQRVSFVSVKEEWEAIFEPHYVFAKTIQGEIIEELFDPRKSFEKHVRDTPWSRLQAFYFAGYAMWIYFNAPFCFIDPDYKVTEIEPWEENGETYRRLQVVFPDHIATHSRVQTFYIDENGLIKRHDYNVEISENAAGAHYLYEYKKVQGIQFPTKRRVFIRKEDNTSLQPEPILVSVNFSNISLL